VPQDDADSPYGEEMVDLLSLTEEADGVDDDVIEPQEMAQAAETAGAKHKKTTKIVLSVIAVLLVAAIAVAAIFANELLDKVVNNSKDTVATTESAWTGMDKLVENFEPIDETEATELSSLQDMIRTWYYNGSPCSSTHVLNVMLIGEDTPGRRPRATRARASSAKSTARCPRATSTPTSTAWNISTRLI